MFGRCMRSGWSAIAPPFVAVCTLIVVAPAPSSAQTEPDALGALQQEVASLKRQVEDLTAAVQDNADAVQGLTEGLGRLTDFASNNVTRIDALRGRIEAMESDREILAEMALDNQTTLGEITASTKDGNPYLRLLTSHEEGRQELLRAISDVAPKEGELRINNQMDADQYLTVNGEQQRVAANSSLSLRVPAGTVSTQLPGQELVNWTVGMPNYQQTVNIKPKAPRTTEVSRVVYRPVYEAPTYTYSAPVYVQPTYSYTYTDPWTGVSYYAY